MSADVVAGTGDILPGPVRAYKLFRVRRDGTIGSLYCDRRARLPLGVWLRARSCPARGLAVRPGWHALARPEAPHLGTRGRAWYAVELRGYSVFERPAAQGGRWLLARELRVLGPVETR